METNRGVTLRVAVVGIADDDPAVLNSLKFSLELEGFVVVVYESAADLLRAGDFSRFDCLVIDQNMPRINGLDLVTTLRDQHFSAPIILITSDPPKALIARANQAGIPIVEKPLLGNSLLEKINEAVAPKAPPAVS